jgi:hypothetical protein
MEGEAVALNRMAADIKVENPRREVVQKPAATYP